MKLGDVERSIATEGPQGPSVFLVFSLVSFLKERRDAIPLDITTIIVDYRVREKSLSLTLVGRGRSVRRRLAEQLVKTSRSIAGLLGFERT